MLTLSRLKELLRYSKKTGAFVRKIDCRRHKAGTQSGSVTTLGYVEVQVDGARYLGHRLAFLYVTGRWPENDVDHRNGNRADNAWRNLRDVPHAVNQQNRRKPTVRNQTGLLGVSPKRAKFAANICVKGRQTSLGVFLTPEAAHTAYLKAKRELHEGCTI